MLLVLFSQALLSKRLSLRLMVWARVLRHRSGVVLGLRLSLLKSIAYPHSIGLLYAALTAYLGFEVNSGEYKVMGLAAFGQPKYKDEFSKLVTLFEDGSYELSLDYFAHHTDTDIGFSSKLEIFTWA